MSGLLMPEASEIQQIGPSFTIDFWLKTGHAHVQDFHFIFCHNTSEHKKYAYLSDLGTS